MDSLFYFLDETFWSRPQLILLFIGSIFLVLILRYFATAVLYQAIVKKLFRMPQPDRGQYLKEIRWSAISSIIFALMSAATFYLYQQACTKIYTNWSEHSPWYFGFSILLLLFLYETYYYWLHRWMHRPSVFKIVHKVHHQSLHPTVFTSFSFHPLEAVLQFIFLPLIVMIIPVHYYALGIVLMIMTISAVINHAGVEIFPKNFTSHPVGKWLIGSTHHDQHHRDFRSNFGLYLTLWDKLMNTENKFFADQFRLNKAKINLSRSQHHQSLDDRHR